MTTLPHIGTTAAARRRLQQCDRAAEQAERTSAEAAERDLQQVIQRARSAPMFAAVDATDTTTPPPRWPWWVLLVIALAGLVATCALRTPWRFL